MNHIWFSSEEQRDRKISESTMANTISSGNALLSNHKLIENKMKLRKSSNNEKVISMQVIEEYKASNSDQ